MTPEKCMSMMLKTMAKIAEADQSAPVHDCVLAVASAPPRSARRAARLPPPCPKHASLPHAALLSTVRATFTARAAPPLAAGTRVLHASGAPRHARRREDRRPQRAAAHARHDGRCAPLPQRAEEHPLPPLLLPRCSTTAHGTRHGTPTHHATSAAALPYGIYKTDLPADKATNVVFLDMGASDTTVSIVSFVKGKLTVLSTACDRRLGGRDFNELLVDHFRNEWLEKHKIDAYTNAKAMFRLRTAADKQKKVLSANAQVRIASTSHARALHAPCITPCMAHRRA